MDFAGNDILCAFASRGMEYSHPFFFSIFQSRWIQVGKRCGGMTVLTVTTIVKSIRCLVDKQYE